MVESVPCLLDYECADFLFEIADYKPLGEGKQED